MTRKELEKKLIETCKKEIKACSYEELYTALLTITEEESEKLVQPVTGRKLYYISAEFLIGKLLSLPIFSDFLCSPIESLFLP